MRARRRPQRYDFSPVEERFSWWPLVLLLLGWGGLAVGLFWVIVSITGE